MISSANLQLNLWSKAVSTACFTQNRSIINKRFNKPPYHILHKLKPDIKYLRTFGCRCYPLNREDIGKLKEKGDVRIFLDILHNQVHIVFIIEEQS